MHEIYAPKWQIAEPHISPDGKSVAFIEGLMSDEGSTGGDIYVVAHGWRHGEKSHSRISPVLPHSLAWTAADQITFGAKCRW